MCSAKVVKKPRRTQSDRTEEALGALRKAALDILVNEGVDELKLANVAERAGYSRSMVNYHFGTKIGMLAKMLNDAVQASSNFFKNLDVRGISAIESMFDAMIDQYEEQPDQLLSLLVLINTASSSSDTELRALVAEYDRQIRKNIELALSDETISSDSNNFISIADQAMMVHTVFRGVGSQWLGDRENFDVVNALKVMKFQISSLLGGESAE